MLETLLSWRTVFIVSVALLYVVTLGVLSLGVERYLEQSKPSLSEELRKSIAGYVVLVGLLLGLIALAFTMM